MNTKIKVMEAALAELKNLHDDHPHFCPGHERCPTARVIHDLAILIGEEKIEALRPIPEHGEYMPGEVRIDLRSNGAEATYPAMVIKDVDPKPVERRTTMADGTPVSFADGAWEELGQHLTTSAAIHEAQAGLGRPRVARLCIDCDAELPATTPITQSRCEECL